MVDPIPAGLDGRIVPYLTVDDAAAAIDFYVAAFGAVERYRMAMPGGGIGHAEIEVHGAVVYLADDPGNLEGGVRNPKALGGASMLLHQYVADVDAVVARAVEAGATVAMPAEDQFYGDRRAVLVDPFGHVWSIHTHVRDVGPEEMEAALASFADGSEGSTEGEG